MSVANLIRSVRRASVESSVENMVAALVNVGWSYDSLVPRTTRSGSVAIVASLAGQPQIVVATGGTGSLSGARPIGLGYSSEAPYTLSWSTDSIALHETARWADVPGDAPLFQDNASDIAAATNLLELIAPPRLAADEPRLHADLQGKRQADLAENLGNALANLRRSVADVDSWQRRGQARDQQLLRLFHQLLFIRFYEDRHPEVAFERVESTLSSPDINTSLARLLARYSKRLESELFTRDAFPVESIPPRALQATVRALTEPWAELRLDFRLTPNDVSGRLYETYLGKQPSVQQEEGTLFPLVGTTDDRSQRGSFYTPTAVATELARSVLEPWLAEHKPTRPSDVRVLDPACGSGAFLLAAYRILREYFTKLRGRPLNHDERRELLSASIFGADLDESALMLAQVQLYEEADLGSDSRLPAMGSNLLHGDSLLSPPDGGGNGGIDWTTVVQRAGLFQVILANPPFGAQRSHSSRVSLEYRKALRRTYVQSHAWGADLAYYFVDLSLRLLSKDGTAGFVLPRKLVSGSTSKEIRRLVASRGVRSLKDYRGAHIFPNVQAYVALLTIGGGISSGLVEVGEVKDSRVSAVLLLDPVSREKNMRSVHVPSEAFAEAPSWTAFELRWRDLQGEVGLPCVELGKAPNIELASGTQTGANSRFVVEVSNPAARTYVIEGVEVDRRLVPQWVRGSDILPFRVVAPTSRRVVLPLKLDSDEGQVLERLIRRLGGRPKNVQLGRIDLWLKPKVILRTFSREPVAAVDHAGSMVAPKGTAGAFAIRPALQDPEQLNGIMGLLHSAFYQWWLRGVGDPRNDETIELSEGQLKRVPWPQLSHREWSRLAKATTEVLLTLSIEDHVERTLRWWEARRSLDNLVFDLLNVSPNLRKIVLDELARPA